MERFTAFWLVMGNLLWQWWHQPIHVAGLEFTPGFIASAVVVLLAVGLALHLWRIQLARRQGRDFSHRLGSPLYRGLMRFAYAPLVFLLVFGCGLQALVALMADAAGDWLAGGESWRYVLLTHYLDATLLWMLLGPGLLLQWLCGGQGLLACPVGGGLSVTFDRFSVLALHVDEAHPNVVATARRAVALIARLREQGVSHTLELKSWLFVQPPCAAHTAVANVRRRFARARRVGLWGSWHFRQWCTRLGVPEQADNAWLRMLEDLAARLLGLLYMLRTGAAYRRACRRLPATHLRWGTYRLASDIVQATGDLITPLPPSPVSVLAFASLSQNLPHIARRFAGLQGGLLVSSAKGRLD